MGCVNRFALQPSVIGFVSAGLVTFSKAVGESSVPPSAPLRRHGRWRFFWSSSANFAFALPMIGISALLRLIARDKTSGAVGAILAGFGLLIIGIDPLQTGMAVVSCTSTQLP
jgi:phosphate:Na+ symporter